MFFFHKTHKRISFKKQSSRIGSVYSGQRVFENDKICKKN